MARTKETKMFPEQQEKMTQEVMASLHPSTYGKDYAQKHSSFFEEVENSDLEVVTENVAATTSNMEDELTNEVQSPPNPQKRISGKQRKATLEEYQQTFLQVPRIDDRKPVFVSSDVRLSKRKSKAIVPDDLIGRRSCHETGHFSFGCRDAHRPACSLRRRDVCPAHLAHRGGAVPAG